ncbi:MAG: ABC transporter substrate-binding protein [Pseudonocardiaceae bacterium]
MCRRILVPLVIAALGLGITACGSGGASGESTLTWAIGAEPRSLDTAHAFDGDSLTVNNEVLEPLVGLNSDGEIEPRLASAWSQPDPTTYVYELRDDVTFWNGSKLTADDVVFSIKRHLDPAVASELAAYVKDVASVTATGPLEVTIKLKAPVPEFQYTVSLVSHTVQKAFAVEHGDDLGNSKTLTMGTGPYQVTRFSADGVELQRNEDYWGTTPTWKSIEIDVNSDPETLRLAVGAGEVDGTFSVPPESSRTWDSLSGVSVQYANAPIVTTLAMDTSAAPWNDPHLRRAMAHAIDLKALVKAVFNGRARVAESIVDPQLWSYIGVSPDEVDELHQDVTNYEFDVEKARQELAKSRHPDGISFTVQYPAGKASMSKALQIVAANLKEVGITLTPKEVPASQWIGYIYAHMDLGVQLLPFGADYPDPGTVRVLLGTENAAPNGFNIANFKPPEIDDLLIQERSDDRAARTEAIHQIAKIVAEEVPYLPLYFVDATLALRDDLRYDGEYSYWSRLLGEWANDVKAAE